MHYTSKVTVALLTYNRVKYLRKAIDAVLQQTYSDFEFLIFDNGSGEETQEVIRSYSGKGIGVIRNEINDREFYNAPFYNSTGEYLMITHDDDIMHPELLEREVKLLDSDSSLVAVGCNISYIDSNDQIIKAERHELKENFIFDQNKALGQYLRGNFLYCSTVLMRKQFFLSNHLKLELRVGPGADIFFLHKISEFPVKMCMLKDVLYQYRKHADQDSQNNTYVSQEQLHENLLADVAGKPVFVKEYTKLIMMLMYENHRMLEDGTISIEEYKIRQAKVRRRYPVTLYILVRLQGYKLKRTVYKVWHTLKS